MRHALALALAAALLSGCASHPELRPYTAEETRQLQLEALQRRGLSLDNYEQQRRVILRAGNLPVVTEAADAERSTKG